MSFITSYHAETLSCVSCCAHATRGSQLAFAILRSPVRDLLFDHYLGNDTFYTACSVSAAGDRSLPYGLVAHLEALQLDIPALQWVLKLSSWLIA